MSERTEERERTRTDESGSDLDFDTDVDIDGLLSDTDGSSGTGATGRTERSAGPTKSTASEATARSAPEESNEGGFRARLRERRAGLFSVRLFVVTLLGSLAAGFLGGFVPVPFVSDFAALLGIFAVAFLVGLVSSGRHYVEAGLAGGAAAGITLVATRAGVVLFTALPDVIPTLGVIGGGAGLLAALVGHYFGRDLRTGLTADI